jgi:hypothetical protein
MPCILKARTENSPGIITFTHNEVLFGVIARSPKVRKFLSEASASKTWIFGVHIQGDCSWLKEWPIAEWQSFVMWPDRNAKFLSNIPSQKFLDMCCINFLPDPSASTSPKAWDICIISRPTALKKIKTSMEIIKNLLLMRPSTKVIFVVPDPRKLSEGLKTYRKSALEKEFYESPLRDFSAEQLKNISFLCTSQEDFGNFPIGNELMAQVIGGSKMLLLTSHQEGTPRVLAEALINSSVCVVSENLKMGLDSFLNTENSFAIPDDSALAAELIRKNLDSFDRFRVDFEKAQQDFCERFNLFKLKDWLSNLIKHQGRPLEGAWYLDDLNFRLAGHLRKYRGQILFNEKAFFEWMARVQDFNPYDEDQIYKNLPADRDLWKVIHPKIRWKFKRLKEVAGKILSRD